MSGRILVAGIGNIFLGDDGFGVEVVRQLAQRDLPEGVQVVDFGIRGMDLAYALLDDYDAVIFVDTAPRGGAPGTLYLIEPKLEHGEAVVDAHGMDPVKVLNFARELGAKPTPIYLLACEPQIIRAEDDPNVLVALSEPVHAAVAPAVQMLESLIQNIGAAAGDPASITGIAPVVAAPSGRQPSVPVGTTPDGSPGRQSRPSSDGQHHPPRTGQTHTAAPISPRTPSEQFESSFDPTVE